MLNAEEFSTDFPKLTFNKPRIHNAERRGGNREAVFRPAHEVCEPGAIC